MALVKFALPANIDNAFSTFGWFTLGCASGL